jgi:hypothetical protein
MDTHSVAAKIADVAQQLERLAAEVQELKALYADALGVGRCGRAPGARRTKGRAVKRHHGRARRND